MNKRIDRLSKFRDRRDVKEFQNPDIFGAAECHGEIVSSHHCYFAAHASERLRSPVSAFDLNFSSSAKSLSGRTAEAMPLVATGCSKNEQPLLTTRT